ncbi:MAG: TolC family protein [Candidatus Hydrothermae bacterium]|nr:TolC family protein [Candidatus Hydrothermae bacterium]
MERMGMVMWGAMLTVPLFLPFRELPRWQADRLTARAARMETSQLLRDLSARLEGMHATWRALALRDSLLRADILPGAEAFFASVAAAFRGGSAGYLEFLDAYRELYRAKKEWLQNRREQGYLHARMAALLGYPNVKEGGPR